MGRKKTTQDRFNDPFPTRFRELSEKAGLNQTQIGEAIGKIRQTISDYQNGISMPDVETVVMLAELFGVTTDYLLGIPGSVPTLDTDLQAVCRYLGLSESAINALSALNRVKHGILEGVLDSEHFLDFLLDLEDMQKKCKEADEKISHAQESYSGRQLHAAASDMLGVDGIKDTIDAKRLRLLETTMGIANDLTGYRDVQERMKKSGLGFYGIYLEIFDEEKRAAEKEAQSSGEESGLVLGE